MSPKVTVYIASHNYGRYLAQAVESVLKQTLADFELLVFDDGSTDETQDILQRYSRDQRVRSVRQEKLGLAATANRALAQAQGTYFVRLDADDYVDENFLLVLSTALDRREDIGLIYSDYYEVDDAGELLGVYRRKNLEDEAELLDLPSHGACTMFRTQVLRELGGYWEDIARQDGLAIWLRFIRQHRPLNVNLPLFYYRKHAASLTTDERLLHAARADILEKFAQGVVRRPSVGLVLPVRGTSPVAQALPLLRVAGAPLVHHALRASIEADIGAVAVVTEDDEVAKACAALDGVNVVRRANELALPQTPLDASIELAVEAWARVGFRPDAIGVVFFTSPLISAARLRQAANTLAAYECTSVVGVRKTNRLHYTHEAQGLAPLFKRRGLKHERDVLYEESGAFVFRRWPKDPLRTSAVGHVLLTDAEAVDIEDRYTLWLATKLLEHGEEITGLANRRLDRGY